MVELTPGSLSNALLTQMLGIAVCWLTLKVPSLLRSRHSQAGLFNVITLVGACRAVGAIGGGLQVVAALQRRVARAPVGRGRRLLVGGYERRVRLVGALAFKTAYPPLSGDIHRWGYSPTASAGMANLGRTTNAHPEARSKPSCNKTAMNLTSNFGCLARLLPHSRIARDLPVEA